MKSFYQPDNWITFRVKDSNPPLYKVLGGWNGGYLNGTSWRINSGIVKIKESKDYLTFIGESGSEYKCHKKMEGIAISMLPTWDAIENKCERIPSKELKRLFK